MCSAVSPSNIKCCFDWTESETQDITYSDPQFVKVIVTGKPGADGKEGVNVDEYSGHVADDTGVMDASKPCSMKAFINMKVGLNPCVHSLCAPGANCRDTPSSSEVSPLTSVSYSIPLVCLCTAL